VLEPCVILDSWFTEEPTVIFDSIKWPTDSRARFKLCIEPSVIFNQIEVWSEHYARFWNGVWRDLRSTFYLGARVPLHGYLPWADNLALGLSPLNGNKVATPDGLMAT